MKKTQFFLVIFLTITCVRLYAQAPIPEYGGKRVYDVAGVLSAETVAQLERTLTKERDSTTNQIGVLIIPSLEGEDIDGYGIRVAEKWKLGDEKNDNGVILIIAIEDRKIRTEVGQGLEGRLTDALSSRINRNEIIPYIKQGDYDTGVTIGVAAIIKAIKGEYTNTNPSKRKRGGKGGSPLTTIIIIIIILVILSRRGGGGLGGYWAAGTLLGGGGGGSFGGSSGSWESGGGGSFGGGGSSDSW
ncbi:MAG: TPM domain-containing protein [Flammeovirgaceae bacterium]